VIASGRLSSDWMLGPRLRDDWYFPIYNSFSLSTVEGGDSGMTGFTKIV
jgi:hypothetical protein